MTKKIQFYNVTAVLLMIFLLWGCSAASKGQIISANTEAEADAGKDGILKNGEDADNPDVEALPGSEGSAGNPSDISVEDYEKIGVYICGAVKNPGVYYLDRGSRLVDGIRAAGGFKENAARNYHNQAAYLKDGQKVRIFTKKQAKNQKKKEKSGSKNSGQIPENGKEDALVNLNTAGKEQLMTLSGVGQLKADAIISYRKKQGKFDKIEDIMKVPGIKEGTFNKIRDKITV